MRGIFLPGLGLLPGLALGLALVASSPVRAANEPFGKSPKNLSQQLEVIRVRVIGMQQDLIESLRTEKQAQASLRKIRALMKLQHEERDIARRRIQELETTVAEFEVRRTHLQEKIGEHQKSIRRLLSAMDRAVMEDPTSTLPALGLTEREKIEAPRRKVLGRLAARSAKEISAMKTDLADADRLEERIHEERRQLAYLFQDLDEKQSLLELNRQLQVDLLEKNHEQRVAQLESYRKLKSAEQQVEQLISEFNAKMEIQRLNETEKAVTRSMNQAVFASLKGKLPLPVAKAKLLSVFGRSYDPKSRLYIFRKGVEISAEPGSAVRAISSGKIAYSGTLPDYGNVAIIDHGNHYYSLCAHLGNLGKKAGESVEAGEPIGSTDDLGTPVYFEIRARNVAVNPLQWVSN